MKDKSFIQSVSSTHLVLGIITLVVIVLITSLVQGYQQIQQIKAEKERKQVQGVSTVQAQTTQDNTQPNPEEPILPDQRDGSAMFHYGLDLLKGLPNDTPDPALKNGIDQLGNTTPGAGGTGGAGIPGNGNTTAVAQWAQEIAKNLGIGCGGYYNALPNPISNNNGYTTKSYPSNDCSGETGGNLLWCADLVREAYFLAGFSDFIHSSYVPAIRNWFKSGPPGYYYIDYDGESNQVLTPAQIQSIKPGCAIIYGYNTDPDNDRGDHIGIIGNVTPDGNGNYVIQTFMANSSKTERNQDVIDSSGVFHAYYRYIEGIGCHQ